MEKLTAPGSQQTLLFITGASGSGKSSFVQAGLLPALEAHYQERHKQVFRAVFRPSSDPLAMLADALSLLGLQELSPQELAHFTLEEFARFLGEHTPKDRVNLLVIDQFEELFTQSAPGQRDVLFSFLAGLSAFENVRTHILVTLRSDFLEELFNDKLLWDIAKQGVELRAMSLEELKVAIQQPLWARYPGEGSKQKRFEAALLERLAEDACPETAYLPLLQVTLQELWIKGSLKLSEYGSLTDAIQRRAEAVYRYEDYETSRPEKERASTDQEMILGIFLDLVDVSLDDDSRRDVRHSRPKSKLVGSSPQRLRLMADLIQARLLSAGNEANDVKQEETVDIIHESLIANWERLREEIDQKRQTLRQRARFEHQLSEWLGNGQSDEYILTGVRLAEARELERRADIALKEAEARAFLVRSIVLEEAGQRRRVRNIIYAAVVLSLALVIALIAAGTAISQTKQLANEKSTSVAARFAAEFANATAEAERDRAETEADISLARQLAAQAQELLVNQPHLLSRITLLSVESHQRYRERASSKALAASLEILPISLARMTHDGVVSAVAFSPDGQWVVSGSNDGTARVWEAGTGQEVNRMTQDGVVTYDNWMSAVAFSPDGQWVISGSYDGTARVWLWRPEDLIKLACARLERNLTPNEWRQYFGERPYHQTCSKLPPGQ